MTGWMVDCLCIFRKSGMRYHAERGNEKRADATPDFVRSQPIREKNKNHIKVFQPTVVKDNRSSKYTSLDVYLLTIGE